MTPEEILAIDRILQSVAEGLKYVEDHSELSAHQAAASGGGFVTTLTNRFRITSEVVEELRTTLTSPLEEEPIEPTTVVDGALSKEDAAAVVAAYLEKYPELALCLYSDISSKLEAEGITVTPVRKLDDVNGDDLSNPNGDDLSQPTTSEARKPGRPKKEEK